MTNSRRKGKCGELEFVNLLKDQGYLSARRSQQYCGRLGDAADVQCDELDDIHFEVKRTETLSLFNAMAQAVRDVKNKRIPVVAHRRSRTGWVIILRAEDFFRIIKLIKGSLCQGDEITPVLPVPTYEEIKTD